MVRLRSPDDVIRIYTGFDPREADGWHTFCASVLKRTQAQVAFIPLNGDQRDGTNSFTYARFLVPQLQDFRGWAIFADGCDMVCLGDVAELWALRNPYKAVHVVKHEYKTRHPRKYVGTEMEAANGDYPRKNWSSLMLINCGHMGWRHMGDPYKQTGAFLHRFEFLKDSEVGDLPAAWNWLVDEYGEAPAKLLHWTAGIPSFPQYKDAPMADVWRAERP